MEVSNAFVENRDPEMGSAEIFFNFDKKAN
jgi:hypothetical protein